ncbi:hypothetical protein GCM10010170_032860 [Dactylosporangium salmoneum]|uniref:AMP-dependent synthetase/ligase domain-containing protein n=1 Tax=Dactylosporangium salmoneum TaxID=53361 RepID=A0ABN3G8A9_9ACTN
MRDRAGRDPDRVALREKHRGIWREITWARYWQTARAVALGLRALGVGPGDRVAIRSQNRPEWLYAAVAAAALGATVADDGAKVLVAEGQEQVDDALAAPGGLLRIVYLDKAGVWNKYDSGLLLSFGELLEVGRGAEGEMEPPDAAGDPATPIGGPRDLLVSRLPLGEPAGAVAAWANAANGAVLHFGAPEDLREVQPTILLAGPEDWTGLHAGIEARVAGASRLKRANARLWLHRERGSALGWLLCHRALRERIGLRHLRHAGSAGPVPPEVRRFFQGIGVTIEDAT